MYYQMLLTCVIITNTFSQEPLRQVSFIELGLYYSQLSYGAFDITIGSVSRLWDFNTDTPDVPDSSAIADALAYVDYTKVSLSTDNDGTHHISIPDGYCLDLGAIAKGYIADKIKASNVLSLILAAMYYV